MRLYETKDYQDIVKALRLPTDAEGRVIPERNYAASDLNMLGYGSLGAAIIIAAAAVAFFLLGA